EQGPGKVGQTQVDDEDVHGEGAAHDQVPVAEVHDGGGPVEHGHGQRHEGVEHALGDTAHDELGEHGDAGVLSPLATLSLERLPPRREHGLLALLVQPHRVHDVHADVVVAVDGDLVGEHAGIEVLQGLHGRDELFSGGLGAGPAEGLHGGDGGGKPEVVEVRGDAV